LGAEATIFITGSLGDNLAFAGANLGQMLFGPKSACNS